MILQLAIGSVLIFTCFLIASTAWVILELVLVRLHGWVGRPPWGMRLMLVLCIALAVALAMTTASVWLWAAAIWGLGGFDRIEPAVYFSLVAFTTLGFGDILLPEDLRLLGGMAAANGMLQFGLLTAMLVETLRETRLRQRAARSV